MLDTLLVLEEILLLAAVPLLVAVWGPLMTATADSGVTTTIGQREVLLFFPTGTVNIVCCAYFFDLSQHCNDTVSRL